MPQKSIGIEGPLFAVPYSLYVQDLREAAPQEVTVLRVVFRGGLLFPDGPDVPFPHFLGHLIVSHDRDQALFFHIPS